MDELTRRQLLALSAGFYRAHAAEFDASRAHHPWPGWLRVFEALRPRADRARGDGDESAPLRVLDVGCGNARLAAFLDEQLAGTASDPDRLRLARRLRYVGVDANAALLEAARARLPTGMAGAVALIQHDFLVEPEVGSGLPSGPFDLVALFGVLHHVPGREMRFALLKAARARLAPGGLLALTAWQFADRPRFQRRRAQWSELPPLLGASLDPAQLEPGDHLLRFGEDPDKPPRYCHQLSNAELDALPEALDLTLVDDFHADGAEGDLNRYLVLEAERGGVTSG
jgi:SAM-dependent methyltransferase